MGASSTERWGGVTTNFTDGIHFHIPRGYELVDLTLKEYVTAGPSSSSACKILKPGNAIADDEFSETISVDDLGVNVLGVQRIGPGNWYLLVSESVPGQTYTLYLRMAPEAWNEAIDLELPGLNLAQDISFVGGEVEWSGVSDSSGDDWDAVRFTVPAGWTIERLMLIDYVATPDNPATWLGVYDDSSATVAGGVINEGNVGEDILDAIGIFYLGSGTYRVAINEVTPGQTYTLRAELGRVIWEEDIQGDLSNDGGAPTPISISSSNMGEFNDVIGHVGDSTTDWDDFAVFTLSEPKTITELTVLEFDPVGSNRSSWFRIYEGIGWNGAIVVNGGTVRPGMIGVNLIADEQVGPVLPPGTYTLLISEATSEANPYTVRLRADNSYVFADGFESGNPSAWD